MNKQERLKPYDMKDCEWKYKRFDWNADRNVFEVELEITHKTGDTVTYTFDVGGTYA